MNCMAVACGEHVFLIDCGVTFPDTEPGVDLIHPDLAWVLERGPQLRAVVLTHGHEDHLGAVPYLLRELAVPVYGPDYALAHLRRRLEEHPDVGPVDLRPTAPGRRFGIGEIEIEPVSVTHSIPDAHALVMRTPAGVLVHSGDFKIDETPLGGEIFDRDRLREVGDEGVGLLMSDSTNVFGDGRTGSEASVVETLEGIVRAARRRVVVAMFSSNLHRLVAAIEIARRAGRKACVLGRSAQSHLAVGIELGYVRDTAAVVVSPDEARRVPRERLLAIVTGTQGEPAAALSRLARGEHRDLELEEGDEVVMSSRIIPGRERHVFAVMDDLLRLGVTVRHRRDHPGVHVSGHARRDEQREMLELLRPRAFLPVHGTLGHLRAHAELARHAGVQQTLVVENGAIVEVDRGGLRQAGRTAVGRVHIARGAPIPDATLRERHLLSVLGVAFAVVTFDRGRRRVLDAQVDPRGMIPAASEGAVLDSVELELKRACGRRLRDDPDASLDDLEDVARRAVRRAFGRAIGVKPLVTAIGIEP